MKIDLQLALLVFLPSVVLAQPVMTGSEFYDPSKDKELQRLIMINERQLKEHKAELEELYRILDQATIVLKAKEQELNNLRSAIRNTLDDVFPEDPDRGFRWIYRPSENYKVVDLIVELTELRAALNPVPITSQEMAIAARQFHADLTRDWEAVLEGNPENEFALKMVKILTETQ